MGVEVVSLPSAFGKGRWFFKYLSIRPLRPPGEEKNFLNPENKFGGIEKVFTFALPIEKGVDKKSSLDTKKQGEAIRA